MVCYYQHQQRRRVMEYFPDKSLNTCYGTLNELAQEAKESAEMLAADGDEDLAALFTSIYIANQNQMMILWHMITKLEKKIDRLLSKENPNENNKRFNF